MNEIIHTIKSTALIDYSKSNHTSARYQTFDTIARDRIITKISQSIETAGRVITASQHRLSCAAVGYVFVHVDKSSG